MKWSISSQVSLNLFGNVHFYMLRSYNCILRNETVWQMPIHVSLLGGVHIWILCSKMAQCHAAKYIAADTGYITLALRQPTYCSLYSQLLHHKCFFFYLRKKYIEKILIGYPKPSTVTKTT